MKISRENKWLCVGLVVLCVVVVFGVYVLGAYVYTLSNIREVTPIATVSSSVAPYKWKPAEFLFVHQVNYRERLLSKAKKYNGFELDTLTFPADRTIYVAHDPRQLKYKMTLQAALALPSDPQSRYFWVDMKTSLTQEQIDDIKEMTRVLGIPLDHLIFEPPIRDDAQAKLLVKNGLHVILQITGFYKENLTPQQSQQLVDKIQKRIDDIKPWGISSGMGNYPYLKAYFPHYNKAICYNTTKRPSLKKRFMRQQMKKDPTVLMFLTDEYDWDKF